jgi:hypothetical protein
VVETIQLNIHLNRAHYLRAARRRFWRALGWLVATAPLLAVLPFWQAAALHREVAKGNAGAIALAASIYAALALFLAFAIELCARMFAQHAMRQSKLALAPQALTFSENGLNAVTPHSAGNIGWSSFRKAVATTWAFQLHFGSRQYVLLPFDQFPSKDVRDQLRQMLKQQLGKRARF